MAKAVLSPVRRGQAQRIGRRVFRKQVLPLTTIDYVGEDGKTRKITFDRPYLQDLADSFSKGAYPQVPFFFADGENRHNEAPDNYRGVIKGLDLAEDGLYMTVETTKDGAKVIKDNPGLGVSARIIEGVARADGKQFPRAVRHVLGTLFPKVPVEGSWAAVDLAEDPDISEVVDLTAANYEEGTDMPETKKRRGNIDLSRLSDEEYENLLDLAEAATLEAEDVDEDEDEDADDDEDDTDEPKARKKKSKVKTTKVVERESEDSDADDDEEDDEDEDEDEEDDDTKLSDRPKARRVRESDADRRIRQVEADLASEAFRRDKQDWIGNGVPPFLVDLAEPVLSMPEAQVVDLSDGKTADVRTILRKMLDGVKGIIDLSAEMGSSIDASDLDVKEDPDKALMDAWDEQYT